MTRKSLILQEPETTTQDITTEISSIQEPEIVGKLHWNTERKYQHTFNTVQPAFYAKQIMISNLLTTSSAKQRVRNKTDDEFKNGVQPCKLFPDACKTTHSLLSPITQFC